MLYLHLISVFLKNFLDYEKTGVNNTNFKTSQAKPLKPKTLHCFLFQNQFTSGLLLCSNKKCES